MEAGAGLCAPDAGFVHAGLEDHLIDLALDRNLDCKIAGLKETKDGAESEAHIELAVLLFSIIAAEAFRKGTRVKPRYIYRFLTDFHG